MTDIDSTVNNGKVWLVGAGPGDPGLITVKGFECIAKADVLVYDYLANPSLLSHAKSGCEMIYVGKIAGNHAMKQEDINLLLCRKAAEGKRVCRLKGGDPFVFGRGGEEAQALREHGLLFEIVPGVTSAVAVPAYAGIPVTHRSMTSSFRVITGHEDPTKSESSLDWNEIAATSGTLVFLMGIRNIPLIAEKLVAAGRSPGTPAAVITKGTTPAQRTVTATLATLAQRVEEEGIVPPGLIVVGEVVSLRKDLNWFERKPLFGRTIAVTRARAQASVLVETLESLGAEVIASPTIRIESMADTPPMREAARNIGKADWVVFTSVNGVDAFFDALALENLDARAFASTKIAAIGPATADALKAKGLRPDSMPEKFVAEAILNALDNLCLSSQTCPTGPTCQTCPTSPLAGQTFLLPRANLARAELAEGLEARGAAVIEVDAYRTLQEDTLPEGLLDRLEKGDVALVTFSSSSTVTNFVSSIPAERRAAVMAHVRAASIGPVTSATLEKAGIAIHVTAPESTIPSLTNAIVAHFAAWKPALQER